MPTSRGSETLPPINRDKSGLRSVEVPVLDQQENYPPRSVQNISGKSTKPPSSEDDFMRHMSAPSLQISPGYTELTQKVRQLEISLMDVRSVTERRLASIVEELPQKFSQDLRTLEQRDTQLHREHQNANIQLQETTQKVR